MVMFINYFLNFKLNDIYMTNYAVVLLPNNVVYIVIGKTLNLVFLRKLKVRFLDINLIYLSVHNNLDLYIFVGGEYFYNDL
jgi:hypothetical protein